MNLSRSTTSKWIILSVMVFGLAAIPLGLFHQANNLLAYGLTLCGAIYNRVDSRGQGYKFTFTAGAASATIETGDRTPPDETH